TFAKVSSFSEDNRRRGDHGRRRLFVCRPSEEGGAADSPPRLGLPEMIRSAIDSRAMVRKTTLAALCVSALALSTCQSGPTGELASFDLAQGSEQNIASLTAVIDRNPGDPEAYNVRGTAYGRGGRYNEALRDFNKALELRPNF